MSIKPVICTKRDLEILSFTGKAGIASLAQLHQRFWPHALESAASSRLRRLEKAGWIASHWIDARTFGEHAYTITKIGARENFTKPERDQFMVGLPLRCELKHLLYAQDLRLFLENYLASYNFDLVKWQNEREIRGEQIKRNRSRDGIPDARAIFTNQPGGMRVAFDIEIDTGQYFGKMLTRKLDAYAKQVDRLILWATLPGRVKRLQSEIQVRQISHMRVIGLPVVRKTGGSYGKTTTTFDTIPIGDTASSGGIPLFEQPANLGRASV